MSRSVNNGETNAKKLITRPIMTVTSPNSPHITFTDTKFRFDHFFDQTYPPSWSKSVLCIESGVVFLSGPKSYQNSRTSTAKFCKVVTHTKHCISLTTDHTTKFRKQNKVIQSPLKAPQQCVLASPTRAPGLPPPSPAPPAPATPT